jgi:glycosyltransferase involved in cell wall biosynthesis
VAPRFAVAHIGVAPYKDLQTVVRTLARVRERGIDAVLVHVGEPWPHDAARLVDELGLSEHVVRLGGVDEQQLVEVLGAADCLLFPSLWEGFGLPPAEAMACGLPVVHSDTPALVELMRGAGLAARPRDVRGLAEHVVTLATDPGVRQRLARDGLARAEALTWDATRAGYRRVYERIHAQVGAGR